MGPKHYMAIPCFATKEKKPSIVALRMHHTDLAVHYIRVAKGASTIVMIIELKTDVPTTIQSVPLKDILELLVRYG